MEFIYPLFAIILGLLQYIYLLFAIILTHIAHKHSPLRTSYAPFFGYWNLFIYHRFSFFAVGIYLCVILSLLEFIYVMSFELDSYSNHRNKIYNMPARPPRGHKGRSDLRRLSIHNDDVGSVLKQGWPIRWAENKHAHYTTCITYYT